MYSKARKLVIAVMLVLTLLWILFIFGNSMKTGAESSEQSSAVQETIEDIAESIGVEEPPKPSEVRTFAHFFEFLVLGAFVSVDVILFADTKNAESVKRVCLFILFGIVFSVVCAFVDEFIQRFSDGRVSDIADVLVDSLGVLVGTAIVAAVYFLVLHIRKKKVNCQE